VIANKHQPVQLAVTYPVVRSRLQLLGVLQQMLCQQKDCEVQGLCVAHQLNLFNNGSCSGLFACPKLHMRSAKRIAIQLFAAM